MFNIPFCIPGIPAFAWITLRNWLHAGENLRRRKTSGIHYVFARRDGKQFSHSVKTAGKATARRAPDEKLFALAATAQRRANEVGEFSRRARELTTR
jgi:hypothetical protein